MRKLKKNTKSGISLIALVITIIVLLILAGISIQMLTGENGIISRTIEAKEKTENTEIQENIELAYLKSEIEKYISDENSLNSIKAELEKNYGVGNVEVFDNQDGTYSIRIKGKIYDIDLNSKSVTASEYSNFKKIYLYNNGDECTDITGGWSRDGNWDAAYSILEATKLSDRIKFYGTDNIETLIATNNMIPFDEYNHICYELNSISTYSTYSNLRSRILKGPGTLGGENLIWAATGNYTQLGHVTYTLDISDVQLPGILVIHVGGVKNYKFELLSVWLER